MSVAFGALASLMLHVTDVDVLDHGQRFFTVLLACAAGAPATALAARLHRESRDGTPSMRPLLSTLTLGAVVGAASQGYLALRLGGRGQVWLAGMSLGHDPFTLMMVGAVLGALAGVVAFVALGLGLRALRALPPVLDAGEKLGVPALAIATVAAAALPLVLDAEELVPAAAVAGLGLAGLVVLARRDGARRAFVTRVFAGTEPGVEIVRHASAADRASLACVADVPRGETVLVMASPQSYRTAARGASLMLLADTERETLAPIVARHRVASGAALAGIALLALRVAALEVAYR